VIPFLNPSAARHASIPAVTPMPLARSTSAGWPPGKAEVGVGSEVGVWCEVW